MRLEEKYSELQRDKLHPQNFELVFIEVYAYVLEQLRQFFTIFKESGAFEALENEIKKKERLYEILVDAALITQSWTQKTYLPNLELIKEIQYLIYKRQPITI